MTEARKRSVAKTVTWRVLASTTTLFLVWLFTGELVLAISVGILEIIIKLVVYYGHERFWGYINWGTDDE